MELKPGAVAILHRTFTQRDFDRFAALSGDDNPIHVDAAFASRTRFGRTVCHGMLLYSTICRALTDALGPGFVQREQELMFVTPTYTGEEVAVRLEVTALGPEQGLADINTRHHAAGRLDRLPGTDTGHSARHAFRKRRGAGSGERGASQGRDPSCHDAQMAGVGSVG